MTKRTTLQQRARELQRDARDHGQHLGYHEALNRARLIVEVQAEHPDQIIRCMPNGKSITIYPPSTPAETIAREMWGPTAAEAEYERDMDQRRSALHRYSKAKLVAMVRTPGAWFSTDPALWTKDELVNDIVQREDQQECYEAYGRVALIGSKPADGTRPLCGGTGCCGHNSATPWPETRERFRAKAPCIDSPMSQTPPSDTA